MSRFEYPFILHQFFHLFFSDKFRLLFQLPPAQFVPNSSSELKLDFMDVHAHVALNVCSLNRTI